MAYRKLEEYDEKTTKELAGHIKAILELLGEDVEREGLIKTPERVAKAMQFLTQGYFQDGEEIVQTAGTARWSWSRTSNCSLCASIICFPSSARRM